MKEGMIFDIQGHRGCRGLMPENTLPAMKLALDLPVTTLEMDVVITEDKKVLVSHEPWFNHHITTKPDGNYIAAEEEQQYNIYKMTYDEVRQYDVGLKPHPLFPKQKKLSATKPLLADVIDTVKASVKASVKTTGRSFPNFNIEIKSLPEGDDIFHPKPADFIELIMAVIKEKGLEEKTNLQSFDCRPLQYLHQHYPFLTTALLIEDYDKRTLEEQLKELGFIPTTYSPEFSLVNEELVQECHRQNMKVIPWTVNDKIAIEELIGMGVDGIITDYPDLFL